MDHIRRLSLVLAVLQTGTLAAKGDAPRVRPATRNIVLVTTDGLRWQEVFRGADEALLNARDGGVADVDSLRRTFWRARPEARREALLPFLWTTVALQGQLYGNVDRASPARVTNGKNFSYPGYNEILSGAADPRIDSNAKRPNPNVSVLEWLNRKPAFHGKVAAVGSWDVFPFILNVARSGLPVNAGWVPFAGEPLTAGQRLLNRKIAESPRVWKDCRPDAFTFPVAMEYLRRDAPRVLYIALGDTDEEAHGGRYDRYLEAAHRVDADLEVLWDTLQARPEYRGTTTLIVTTDHGRGDPPRGWRDHGESTKGSDAIWIAILGPDTPALGERTNTAVVTQGQVAATVAALLGEDYRSEAPRAARPIPEVVRPSAR